jgi:uncharacterized membrane protein YbhN (UPF0104 family)
VDATDEPLSQRPVRRVTWLSIAKMVIVVLVVYGILRAMRSAWAEFDESPVSLRDLRWRWLVLAATLYAAAQVPMAWYWQQLLGACHIVVGFTRCLRAFIYGHLGKYVPGKFMVVIIRSGLLGLSSRQVPLAVSSVFVETFTYMAAGAFAAAVGIAFLYRGETRLQVAAFAVMFLMMVGTWPPLLRWALDRAHRWRIASNLDLVPSVNTALIAKGWAASLITWLLNALSLFATLSALPMPDPLPLDGMTVARLMTSLCAAVVAGFVSMVPGGLLAREYVLDRLLVPHFGEVYALLAAVLLRIVWLLTEVIGSTILYVAGRR